MTTRSLALASALAAAVLATLAPAAIAAGPADLYYERSLMGAAGARCGLFEPAVLAALVAATRQAKGAALRAGADPDALAALEARARERAAAAACASPDLATVAARVKKAFAGYSRITAMTFPGQSAGWRAERGTGARAAAWRLSQSARTPSGPLAFGVAALADDREMLGAVAGWPGALGAAGARLLVRDPAKAAKPYLDRRRPGLAAQAPPRSVARVFLASTREAAPAGLLPAGATVGALFRFPSAAATALEALDPREAAILELVYPARDGERVETTAIEVGDFAAGRAFLAVGR